MLNDQMEYCTREPLLGAIDEPVLMNVSRQNCRSRIESAHSVLREALNLNLVSSQQPRDCLTCDLGGHVPKFDPPFTGFQTLIEIRRASGDNLDDVQTGWKRLIK